MGTVTNENGTHNVIGGTLFLIPGQESQAFKDRRAAWAADKEILDRRLAANEKFEKQRTIAELAASDLSEEEKDDVEILRGLKR